MPNIYQTSNNNFPIAIKNIDRWVDEGTISWNNNRPNLIGDQVGDLWTNGNIQNNSANTQVWRSSSNIANYVQGRNEIQVGLYSGSGTYAFFCSKDGKPNTETAPCQNGGHTGPQLSIIYTKKPTPPTITNFNKTDDVGQCDLSKSTGKCDVTTNKALTVGAVNSGDGSAETSRTKYFTTNQIDMTNSNNNEIENQRIYQTSNQNNTDGRTESVTYSAGVGVFRTTVQNEDQFNIHSDTINNYYQIDNGSPVAYSGIKAEGVKSSDGSYLIGRSNPENTQAQVKFNTPDYSDALYNKFSIIPEGSNSILDISGGFDPMSNEAINVITIDDQKYNPNAQVFTQDGLFIKANNANRCWDMHLTLKTLITSNCHNGWNQKIQYQPTTKQFKIVGVDTSNPTATYCLTSGYSDRLVRFTTCSAQLATQRFNVVLEDIVRITTPGGKNTVGATNNSAQIGGYGVNSNLFSNNTSMVFQLLRYLRGTEQIRTNENVCLDFNSPFATNFTTNQNLPIIVHDFG